MPLIQVVCSNICANPLRAQWRVRRRITQAARIPGIHAGSEIEYPRYWNAWRRIMHRFGMASFGIGHEVPISLDPKQWHLVKRQVHTVHGGLKDVSPSRFINEVQALHEDGSKVAVLACHPVSWGYPSARHKAGHSWEWRHRHLELYLAKLRALVKTRLAAGYSVIVVGDMNYPDKLHLHAEQVELAHSGLDHIWVIPANGCTVRKLAQRSIPPSKVLGMDHPILIGRGVLTGGRP